MSRAQDLSAVYSTLAAAPTLTFKVGDVIWSCRGAAPTGFLACDGTAISRTTYAALFAVLGTTFGVGDGSTTFNLPDARGRTMIGTGTGVGLTARALGANGGAETHQLSVGEMPAHTHTYGTGGTGGGGRTDGGTTNTAPTGSAGLNQAHNNMQPFLAVNAFIYAGA